MNCVLKEMMVYDWYLGSGDFWREEILRKKDEGSLSNLVLGLLQYRDMDTDPMINLSLTDQSRGKATKVEQADRCA